MLRILRAYAIPAVLVSALADTYTDTKAKVLSPDGKTDVFDITAGVLQGDTLAPFLFIIVLDYALKKAVDGREEELGLQPKQRRSKRCPATSQTWTLPRTLLSYLKRFIRHKHCFRESKKPQQALASQ